jgi:hypothetical protein
VLPVGVSSVVIKVVCRRIFAADFSLWTFQEVPTEVRGNGPTRLGNGRYFDFGFDFGGKEKRGYWCGDVFLVHTGINTCTVNARAPLLV